MGTINSAFSLISGALDADQSALNIVAGNVANANTPGYTRETPTWQENTPVTINGVSYGAGVTETGATSMRDRVLLERLDQQQQLASASSARLDALNDVQTLFTPSSGSATSNAGNIGSDITGFFNSFSSLEANPTDNSLRQHRLHARGRHLRNRRQPESAASRSRPGGCRRSQPGERAHVFSRPTEHADSVSLA
jgi:flagellar hook-associated protein 1 FlgK